MFFSMLAILIFQFFDGKKVKSLLVIIVILPSIFFTSYQLSDLFKNRVNSAISDVINFSEIKETSVGQRISFTINSFEVIKDNPIFGVGTGDFPIEYHKINLINSPSLSTTTNPHNMYILILMQLGLTGLISLLAIFYFQIKSSFYSPNKFIRDVGITLPLLFLVIMFSDSYLLGHFTTLMFVFFSAFLYKDSEYN